MKLKFIINIFIVLSLTLFSLSLLHFYYLRNERLRLIDREIETTASALITSDLSTMPLDDLEETEDYLHEILGTQKIGKIILLTDRYGRQLFANQNADLLPDDFTSTGEKWRTIKIPDHVVRLLEVQIPGLLQTLQVGTLLDTELSYWKEIDNTFIFYSIGLLFFILALSYFLASWLLSPLRKLALYLDHLTSQFEAKHSMKQEFSPIPFPSSRTPDEFNRLINSVNSLTEKLRLNLSTFQNWTALMAHEMKTPMTIIKNQLESKDPKKIENALGELDHLDQLMNTFLDWANLENTNSQSAEIYAIDINAHLEKAVQRHGILRPEKLHFTQKGKITVFAKAEHVDQLLDNLISNAIKYTASDTEIEISLDETSLRIVDKGPGIPQAVLDKMGQPFNFVRQGQVKGSGLGLAWVNSICKKYSWLLDIQTSEHGTTVKIVFS